MVVADNGDLYVADTGNARVQVFDKNGAYLRQITALNGPYDVALDGSGGLWVMDGNRVIKFNASTGNAISSFSSWYDAQSNDYYFYGSNQSIAFGNGYLFVGSYDGDYGNAVDTFKP
jgi:DNA-binding beta-propeller fold protein YncE